MTAERFRKIALGLQGAVEGAHMGHPDFRANGKIFATLYPDGHNGMVKLTPDQQAEFVAAPRRTFVPASGAWDVRDARLSCSGRSTRPRWARR